MGQVTRHPHSKCAPHVCGIMARCVPPIHIGNPNQLVDPDEGPPTNPATPNYHYWYRFIRWYYDEIYGPEEQMPTPIGL